MQVVARLEEEAGDRRSSGVDSILVSRLGDGSLGFEGRGEAHFFLSAGGVDSSLASFHWNITRCASPVAASPGG